MEQAKERVHWDQPTESTIASRVAGFATAGIAAAAAGDVVLVAGIALLSRKRGSDDEVSEHVQWQSRGDAYLSSPFAFQHAVEYPGGDAAEVVLDQPGTRFGIRPDQVLYREQVHARAS